ncbi:3-isopropylmalate dehydrogenase [Advenella kashmirensis W13003]|uniref:3-isopropylmalate dehydrogenase n=1 Tax=Advenella kashmirensis W13003 TaxID=1424334 RepID=V8QWD8_9BURK|nr:3-isopropylmalate dehydrogenase [Advenella kashmirensis]ETF03967.1 3-isopropylmalate dehydrogenase [Advenella kashmirensis W13003]
MKIAVLAGDGIGPEVTAQAVIALETVLAGSDKLELVYAPIGGAAVSEGGDPLPEATLETARQADAILFGAAGMPGDESLPYAQRPGASLLRLRQALGLFANYRPALLFPALAQASTLKPEVINGLDMMILRELSSDVYFGEPRGERVLPSGEREGYNTMRYSESEIERIAHCAFQTARQRRKRVCSVDKANVLESMLLWRDVVTRVGTQYPDVALSHLFVDAAAMAMMRRPLDFDVIVTGNLFGDILSDLAAMMTGSIGMLPSASLNQKGKGLYEPVHGSAPDIAGHDLANPIASILSVAMMLRYSFDMAEQAERIERAVSTVLEQGLRTQDIATPGQSSVGTRAMGEAIAQAIASQAR